MDLNRTHGACAILRPDVNSLLLMPVRKISSHKGTICQTYFLFLTLFLGGIQQQDIMPLCKNAPSVSCCEVPNMQNRNKTMCKYPAASLILTATCFGVPEYPLLSLMAISVARKGTLKQISHHR